MLGTAGTSASGGGGGSPAADAARPTSWVVLMESVTMPVEIEFRGGPGYLRFQLA